MGAARALDSLSTPELEAISTLWKRERRVLVTSFTGVSMLPAIAPGQEVVVQCGVEPAVGDVAVFHFRDRLAVHRVVPRTATWLLTWGDANPLPDEPIEPIHVLGVIRHGFAPPRSMRRGLLLRFLASPHVPIDLLTRRVRVAYRLRAAWGQGPLMFAKKALRAAFRPLFPR